MTFRNHLGFLIVLIAFQSLSAQSVESDTVLAKEYMDQGLTHYRASNFDSAFRYFQFAEQKYEQFSHGKKWVETILR